jgi:hypothetical protein
MDDDASYSLEEAGADAGGPPADPPAPSPAPASERVTSGPLPAAPPAFQSPAFSRFGPSRRARIQRRLLAWVLTLLVLCSLYLLLGALASYGWPWSWPWVKGLWILLAAAALFRIHGTAAASLAGREVQLGPLGLELRRDGFKRLVVFDSLRHLRLTQAPAGRLHSLRLDLDDGSVTVRDVEGLERIFAAAAQGRPEGVLIEVEERRVDWEEPLPWILLILALALLSGLAFTSFL